MEHDKESSELKAGRGEVAKRAFKDVPVLEHPMLKADTDGTHYTPFQVKELTDRVITLEAEIERLEEGIKKIRDNHKIPREHRHGSTTHICNDLLKGK